MVVLRMAAEVGLGLLVELASCWRLVFRVVSYGTYDVLSGAYACACADADAIHPGCGLPEHRDCGIRKSWSEYP